MAARYRERIGERIREAREARNWTQPELARRLPGTVDAASISRWETGRVEPRADNLQALADALEVDPAYFLAPKPQPGTSDLMGTLNGAGGEPSQLDRIEAKLDELLSRLAADRMVAVLEAEVERLRAQASASDARRTRKPRSDKAA